MDLLYTANKKYIDMMLASIYSVYLNGCLNDLKVHIIYNDFSIDDIIYVEKFLKTLPNLKFNFYFLDEQKIEKYHIPTWKGSHIANARLFFQSILKDKVPDKLLYLDADTICVGDISGLEEYRGSVVYAVRDSLHKFYTQRFQQLDNYYNSGVLYIDTEKWAKIDAEGKIIDFASNSPWELVYPDQDIFNCALDEYIAELSVKYNYPPQAFFMNEEQLRRFHAYREMTAEELLDEKDNVRICHPYGASGIKPWTDNKINPYNELFMEYLLKVNPEFKKEKLALKEKILTSNKRLYIMWILFKNHIASSLVAERDIKTLGKVNKK